jgi:glycosyltransferase involved in cell wall biosynthesis
VSPPRLPCFSGEHGSQQPTSLLKILLDLKPALDGFAGIPQESRLLFRGLLSLEGIELTGLIQHGSAKLQSALPLNFAELPASERILRLSRAIISLEQNLHLGVRARGWAKVRRHFEPHVLLWDTLRGRELQTSFFDGMLFPDFVWRIFFSKTLDAVDKDAITTARYRILMESRRTMTVAGLRSLCYFSRPRFARIQTSGLDAFIAQTPFPGRVSEGTRLIIRYHDAVPLLMPHTIADKAFHQASHFYALQENVRDGAWLCCISEATRTDLLRVFPEAEPRTVVIPNIVAPEFYEAAPAFASISQIIETRLARIPEFRLLPSTGFPPENTPYLLIVSTLEPRKNHALLLAAWERLKATGYPELKLVVVGNLGWMHEPILRRFQPWMERGDLWYLQEVPIRDLRALYQNAAATVCPSLAEGFDYSGVEAMASGGVVVASDIPVHREVYGEAALYFDPYSESNAETVLRILLDPENHELRTGLAERGPQVSRRYTSESILPRWKQFLKTVQGETFLESFNNVGCGIDYINSKR